MTGTGDPFAEGKRPARAVERISDTRVLCVATVSTLGTMLSVDEDTTARPVHERPHARSPCIGAR